ncbi:DNA cytosine methyltransferase [Fulvimarina endophytica]|nr:DNA (cytosine-5-)-methyltransferase [Fulvimarina endophytica]
MSEIEALERAVLSPECPDEDRSKLASEAERLRPIASYLFGEDGDVGSPVVKLTRWADGDFATMSDVVEEDEAKHQAKNDDADVTRLSNSVARPAPKLDCLLHPYTHDLTALELFSGAGGMAAGLAQAGFRHAALVEHLPHACETLRAAFGSEHVVETDVRSYTPDRAELGPIDLLSGGPPCQPFSISGERGGASDKRDMFPEFLRLVDHVKPRSILIENVEGLFHAPFDYDRFQIQARLKRMGYTTEWRRVSATHFGVAQNRIRSILVGFRDKDAMARFVWPTAIVPHYVSEPLTVYDVLRDFFHAKGWDPSKEDLAGMAVPAPTLTGGSDKKCGADLGQQHAREVWEKMGFIGTRIGRELPKEDHEGPVEITNSMCAKLQGFSPQWPFAGGHVAVYKQIANAFPPPVARHLGCAIASALTGTTVDPRTYSISQAMRPLNSLRNRSRRNTASVEAMQVQLPARQPRPTRRLDLRSLQAASEMIDDDDELVWVS